MNRRLLFFTILFAGMGLRILAASSELWLDEYWSIALARSLSKASDVIRATQSDNNHLLNTLWIFAVGPHKAAWILRLPAILASLVVIVGCGKLCERLFPNLRDGRSVGAAVGAFAYPLVLYGSEARGYSLMLAALVLLLIATSQFPSARNRRLLLLFWSAGIVGMLAHGSFVPPFLVTVAVLLYRAGRKRAWLQGLLWVSLPFLTMLLLWFLFWSRLPAGTGPLSSVYQQMLQTLVVVWGGPEFGAVDPARGLLWIILALVGSAFLTLGCLRQRRWQLPDAALVLANFLGTPLLIWFLLQPRVSAVRYLLPALLLAQLFIVGTLLEWRQHSLRVRRFLITLGIAGLLVSNCANVVDLLRYGRGGYAEALALIAYREHASPENRVLVGGDFDFRNALIIGEMERRGNEAATVIWYQSSREAKRPEILWYIRNFPAGMSERFIAHEADVEGGRFVAQAFFPAAGLSGAGWQLLRRADSPISLQ